ncbi:MAG: amidophosphoribosyltransferase [Fimbriimonadales bacterium]|nr:MAG: amidophosphoribosyltransferase [Fimbriimonadales bacterium]
MWNDDAPREACGLFGVYAPGEDVARLTYFGLFALQHRGQESAGIAVSDGDRIRAYKDLGLVARVFTEPVLQSLQGHIAVGHTRYSTTGSSTLRNVQPITCSTEHGNIAVAHNGNLVNAHTLRAQLEAEGEQFESTNDSEVIVRLIARALESGAAIVDAIRQMMAQVEGAYALAILTPTQLIGVRDPFGVRPLCVGKLEGAWVLASETCALPPIGATYVRDVLPGEVVVIDANGLRSYEGLPNTHEALCMFELIYFARPDSHLYGRLLYEVRRRMGRMLAQEHPVEADLVIPVPDSGVPAAVGYAAESGIPYGDGLIKNRYAPRTFIQPDQRLREQSVRLKLTPLREVIAGKRLVVIDDSIVRGTTTRQIVRILFEAGAREVHMRITAPPIRYPCHYGIDMATQRELVAAHHTVDDVRKQIGATSLGYLSIEGLAQATGQPRARFCLACFNGEYPIPIPNDVELLKEMFETPRTTNSQEPIGVEN